MATRGKSARQKGHSYERDIIDFFKELGYTECCSSRSESKRADDKGIDVMYTKPFTVQCKAVEQLSNYHKVLASMPQDENYNLVFHKRNRQGTVVAMTLEDFKELVQMLISNKIINPK